MIFELSMLVTQPRITNRAEFEIYWDLHMNSVELQGTQVPSVWTRTKEFSSSELFEKALPGSLAVYPQSGNSQRTCKWSVGGRRPVLTGVYIHVLLADNLHTSISLSKSWWKFLCVLPIRLTPSISHSFLFPSCLPFQGWSHAFPVKFWDLNSWIISLFSLPPLFLTSSSLRIKTPSVFCLGGKRALHWVLFPKSPVTNPNSFLPSPSIFIKDFAATVIFSLWWHNFLRPEFSQTCILILLSSPRLPVINRLVSFSYSDSTPDVLGIITLDWTCFSPSSALHPLHTSFDQFSVFFPGTSSASYLCKLGGHPGILDKGTVW